VLLEPFWCRPNWAVAHAWHVALAVAGSLVSLASPVAAAAMLGVALLSVIVDALTGCSPGRRLTAEHASQNVVAVPPTKRANSSPRVHLILTANYDAARVGVAYRNPFRRTSSSLRRTVRGIT